METSSENTNLLAVHLFRENAGKMTAFLCRRYSLSQLDDILDLVHDTFETALLQWKFSGIPQNPEAWLMLVAKNKAINYFKKKNRLYFTDPFVFFTSEIQEEQSAPDKIVIASEAEDGQLSLLFACCSSEVSDRHKIMVTLNILCGFSLAALANALLMKHEAVKKALFRAKELLREDAGLLHRSFNSKNAQIISTIHSVLYLMFNEGYKSTNVSTVLNHDLCYEAMRLTKLLLSEGVTLQDETNALLALMFFNLSRFPARLTTDGEIITLADQNRKKWDQTYITEGHYYLSKATRGTALSSYHLEAIISSIHCAATAFDKTDWNKIAFLYEQLMKINPSPMVTLNAIAAKSYVHGCVIALQHLEALKTRTNLPDYPYWMLLADLYNRSGRAEKATEAYKNAMDKTRNRCDQQFLKKKMREINGDRET